MIFDFQAYLGRVDPDIQYHIEIITGGVVNLTIRASKVGNIDNGTFPGCSSIVLKYAPPFFAAIGEHALFSQYRQTIEARAIALSTTVIRPNHGIMLPTLLEFDQDEHVLTMRDLGKLPNLADIFLVVGGFNPMNITMTPGKTRLFVSSKVDLNIQNRFKHIGKELGQFFALLHSPAARDAIVENPSQGPNYLSNPEGANTVFENEIMPLRNQLSLFSDMIAPQQADEYYARIENNYKRIVHPSEQSFVLGDCWPAAILIEDPFSATTLPKIGVIDWELASIGRGLHGDISQFLAHLELLHIASRHQNMTTYTEYIDKLVDSLISEYTTTSMAENSPWTFTLSKHTPNDPERQTHQEIHRRIIRSAFLSHAVEMIACAFWKVWPCSDPSCPCPRLPSNQDFSTTSPSPLSSPSTFTSQNLESESPLHAKDQIHQCTLIRKMVSRAIWYINVSGRDLHDLNESEISECASDSKIKDSGMGLLRFVSL